MSKLVHMSRIQEFIEDGVGFLDWGFNSYR